MDEDDLELLRQVDRATEIEMVALQGHVAARLQLGADPEIVACALYLMHMRVERGDRQPPPEWAAYLRQLADRLEQGWGIPFPPPPLVMDEC